MLQVLRLILPQKENQVATTLAASQVLVSPYEKLKEKHAQLIDKLKVCS